MIQPDHNIMHCISVLSSGKDTRAYWEEIVEWFQKSYADRSTKNVTDVISSEKMEHINQGRALELLEICKHFNRQTKEDPRNDTKRTGGMENF